MRLNNRILSFVISTAVVLGNLNFSVIEGAETQSKVTNSDEIVSLVDMDEANGIISTGDSQLNSDEGTVATLQDVVVQNKKAVSESSYDSRDIGVITSVKDQGRGGCCWAFACMKAIEADCISSGLVADNESIDLSENHLVWYSYCTDPDQVDANSIDKRLIADTEYKTSPKLAYTSGGSALYAMFSLASWSGVEKEENYPYSAATLEDIISMGSTMDESNYENRFSSYAHLRESNNFDGATTDEIKDAIVEYGALEVAMYYDSSYLKQIDPTNASYYEDLFAGTSNPAAISNHCVTLIGWDDNYPKENFKVQPENDGAWLIANSYGSDENGDGCFWLSYEDDSLCEIYSFDVDATNNYSEVYQYDYAGYYQTITLSTRSRKGGADVANVFTATQDTEISAVSLYSVVDNQECTVNVYTDVDYSPESGSLVDEAETSTEFRFKGYHTIDLEKPVSVKAGEKFSVVVTYKKASDGVVYIPVEGATRETEFSGGYLQHYFYSNVGESFLDCDGWCDLASFKNNGTYTNLHNACIKAFAKADGSAAADLTSDVVENATNNSTNDQSFNSDDVVSNDTNDSTTNNDSSNVNETIVSDDSDDALVDNNSNDSSEETNASNNSNASQSTDSSAQNSTDVANTTSNTTSNTNVANNTNSTATNSTNNTSSTVSYDDEDEEDEEDEEYSEEDDEEDYITDSSEATVGSKFRYGSAIYMITSMSTSSMEVRLVEAPSRTSFIIPKTVALDSDIYNVTGIGAYAFEYTGCRKIVVPNSIKTIYNNAFAGDPALKRIIIKAKKFNSVGRRAFVTSSSVTVRVPAKVRVRFQRIIKSHGGRKVTVK